MNRRSPGRVLVVSDMGDAQPSGALRAMIYRERFASHGIRADYVLRRSPALNRFQQRAGPTASRLLSLGPGKGLRVIDQIWARANEARILATASRYDVIYLQKITSPRFVKLLRTRTKSRLVYDFGDAVWLKWRAGFAGSRIIENLKYVDAVTTDGPHTREYIRKHNPNVFILPDPPQVEAFDALRAQVQRGSGPIVLGWVGTPGTAFNLFHIWEPLERLFRRRDDITLRLVGVGRDMRVLPRFEDVDFSVVPFYDQTRMINEVLRMDIGLFPMFEIEDSLTRGIMKASLYMAGEAVAVSSPRGQMIDFIQDGVNGYLPGTPHAWEEVLNGLIDNAELRRRIAAQGLATVRQTLTLERCFQCLLAALLGDPALTPEVPGVARQGVAPLRP